MPVLLLEQVHLLKVTIEVLALIVPRVVPVVDVLVGPFVTENNATVRREVAECIQNMREAIDGHHPRKKLRRRVVSVGSRAGGRAARHATQHAKRTLRP